MSHDQSRPRDRSYRVSAQALRQDEPAKKRTQYGTCASHGDRGADPGSPDAAWIDGRRNRVENQLATDHKKARSKGRSLQCRPRGDDHPALTAEAKGAPSPIMA